VLITSTRDWRVIAEVLVLEQLTHYFDIITFYLLTLFAVYKVVVVKRICGHAVIFETNNCGL